MALFSLISLTLFATATANLGCEDFSYNNCHDPPATQELHVGSLDECIQNCDLFGSFDQCDFIMFYGSGRDENCHIISGDGSPDEEMAKYLAACRVVGQPMKKDGGSCMEGPLGECATALCSPGCESCAADKCSGYHGSQCQKIGEPGETSPGLPNYTACLSYCTLQMLSNPWTYLAYDLEAQECICYLDEKVDCAVDVVRFGTTMAEVTDCQA